MGIFSKIMGKIFPTAHAATIDNGSTAKALSDTSSIPTEIVDAEAILNALLADSGQTLNWQNSIVDLLKLLGLDSSLEARKKLAAELNYNGSTEDSAAMNMWLHKEVMSKIAANGGKLPADLQR